MIGRHHIGCALPVNSMQNLGFSRSSQQPRQQKSAVIPVRVVPGIRRAVHKLSVRFQQNCPQTFPQAGARPVGAFAHASEPRWWIER